MNKTPSSYIEPNQKLRNLEQEKAQAEHRSQRLQNRERYLSEGARKKRTHHLCNMGGAIEALCPQVAALNKADFYRVLERIFALSEVQDILLDMTLEDNEDDIESISSPPTSCFPAQNTRPQRLSVPKSSFSPCLKTGASVPAASSTKPHRSRAFPRVPSVPPNETSHPSCTSSATEHSGW